MHTQNAKKDIFHSLPSSTAIAILSSFSYIVVKVIEGLIGVHGFPIVVFGEFAVSCLFAGNVLRALGVHK